MNFTQKLEVFRNAYKNNNLLIISDFNRTLTLPGTSTSFSSIAKGNFLRKEYLEKRDELFKEYFPYEIGELGNSLQERQEKVDFWFESHLKLLVDEGLTKSMLREIVKENKNLNEVRENFTDFFNTIQKYQIPLVIVSGGLGDIIDLLLQKYKIPRENFKIISNYFIWNSEGLAIDYNKNHIVNTINKENTDLGLDLGNETCIIVLGDSPEDLDILNNLNFKESLSVGFKVKSQELGTNNIFDIEFEKEASLAPINEFLEKICK